jgi:AmmeMemoRadiSam system protein A
MMRAPLRSEEDRRTLLAIARRAITAQVIGAVQAGDDGAEGQALNTIQALSAGVFVTLREAGDLRGCIGHMEADEPLVASLVDAAVAACSRDPRFPPVRPDELARIAIELSILGPLEPVATLDDVEIGRHGLVVEQAHRRGLLLPQVAVEHQWTPASFVSHTCHKAGLSDDAWERGASLWKFEAEVFAEPDLCPDRAHRVG